MEKLALETTVRYHGSIEEAHGEFIICAVSEEFLGEDETVRSTDGARYAMYAPGSKFHDYYGFLRQVRRQSITPVETP